MSRRLLLLTIGADPLPVTAPVTPVTFDAAVAAHTAPALPPPTSLVVATTVDGAQLRWARSATTLTGITYTVEAAPDASGAPGAWTVVEAGLDAVAYALPLPTGARWVRVLAYRNGLASAPTSAVLATPAALASLATATQLDATNAQVAASIAQEVADRSAAIAAEALARAAAIAAEAAVQTARADAIQAQLNDVTGQADVWNNTSNYPAGDFVRLDGKLYRALVGNTNVNPAGNPGTWEQVGNYASAGEAITHAVSLSTSTANDLAVESQRIDGISARMPAGNGSVASTDALSAIEGRVALTEGGLIAQSGALTAIGAQFDARNAGYDSLVPDYPLARALEWESYYGHDLTGRFVTDITGRPLSSGYRTAGGLDWNQSRTAIPMIPGETYRLEMDVNMAVGADGFVGFTWRIFNADKTPHVYEYDYAFKTVERDGTWHHLTHDIVADDLLAAGISWIRPGWALNHGGSGGPCMVQMYRFHRLIRANETHGLATSSGLSALDSRVTEAEGGLAAQSGSMTALSNEVVAARAGAPSLDARLDGLDTTVSGKASSTALSELDGRVAATETGLTAQSGAVTAIGAQIDARNVAYDSLVPDYPLARATEWESYYGHDLTSRFVTGITGRPLSTGYRKTGGLDWTQSKTAMPLVPGETYRLEMDVNMAVGADGAIGFTWRTLNANKSVHSSDYGYAMKSVTRDGTWHHISHDLVADDLLAVGICWIKPGWTLNHGGAVGESTIQAYRCHRLIRAGETSGLATADALAATTARVNNVNGPGGGKTIETLASDVNTLAGAINDAATGLASKASSSSVTAVTNRLNNTGTNSWTLENVASNLNSIKLSIEHPATGLAAKAAITTTNAISGRLDNIGGSGLTLEGLRSNVVSLSTSKADITVTDALTVRMSTAEGVYKVNLLRNAGFAINSRGWGDSAASVWNSANDANWTWGRDQLGAGYVIAGTHNLGISHPGTPAANQYLAVYSEVVDALPSTDYLLSCLLAKQSLAGLAFGIAAYDGAGIFIADQVVIDHLTGSFTGGTNRANWKPGATSFTTPANTKFLRAWLRAATGGTPTAAPKGWLAEPMLERKAAGQTVATLFNFGPNAAWAGWDYTFNINGYISGMRWGSDGRTSDVVFVSDSFTFVPSDPAATEGMFLSRSVMALKKGGKAVRLGPGFGADVAGKRLILAYGTDGSTETRTRANSDVFIAEDMAKLTPGEVNLGSAWESGAGISVALTAGSPATGTISVTAGVLAIGNNRISYAAATASISGTGGSTVTYYLYFIDPGRVGGAQVLYASTDPKVTYAYSNYVIVGAAPVTFPTSGSTTSTGTTPGGDTSGSGGGIRPCVTVETWVIERTRGIVTAGTVVEGNFLLRGDGQWRRVTHSRAALAEAVQMTAEDGATLPCSTSAPIMTGDGFALAPEMTGKPTPRWIGTPARYTGTCDVVDVQPLGQRLVQHITLESDAEMTLHDRVFLASSDAHHWWAHHNIKAWP